MSSKLKTIIPKPFKVFSKKLIQRIIDILVRYNLIKLISAKKIDQLKDSKNNHHKCFIIGSGPSIGKQNLNLLKNHFTIVHNTFFSVQDNYNFTPNLYVVEDALVASEFQDQLNLINNTNFVTSHGLKKFIRPKKNVHYINFDYSYLDSFKAKNNYENLNFKFSENIKEKAFWGGTVVYLSLQLAYFLGFKEIYLLGVDLSYTIPKNAKIEGNVITSSENNNNHHGNMYAKGVKWNLPKTDRMKLAIEHAIKFLSTKNISVYNCSPKSKIEGAKNVIFNELLINNEN